MSKIPRSPTAVDTSSTCDPSQPEWKKELIRRKILQKRVFIRLPNALLQRERNVSIISPPPAHASGAAAAAANGESALSNSNTAEAAVNNRTVYRLTRDDIDGLDGLNGYVRKPLSNIDAGAGTTIGWGGSEHASVNQQQQASRNKLAGAAAAPLESHKSSSGIRSNNNECSDVIRAWLPQSGGEEGGTDEAIITAAASERKTQSNDASSDVVRVSDGRKGALPMTPMQLHPTVTSGTRVINRSKETMGDYTTGSKILGMGVKNSDMILMVNAKNDLHRESSTPDFYRLDGLNGNEESYDINKKDDDYDPDYDYGPGIVNRLRAKFITLSLKGECAVSNSLTSPVSPISPVRRVASCEQLLDVVSDDEPLNSSFDGGTTHGVVGRTKGLYEKNANLFRGSMQFSKSLHSSNRLKRARSMDNVTAIDRAAITNHKDFLTSKKIIIIEQPKPLIKPQVDVTDAAKKNHTCNKLVPDTGRNVSPSLQNTDEYPMPNTVREYMKLFEHQDENKNALVITGGTVAHCKTAKAKLPPPPKSAGVLPSSKSGFNVSKQIIVTDEQENEKELPKSHNEAPVVESDQQQTASSEPEHSNSSVKCRIGAFSDILSKSQPAKSSLPSANTVDSVNLKSETVKTVSTEIQKPVGSISPFQREPPRNHVEEESISTVPTKPPKIVNHIPAVDPSKLENAKQSQMISNSESMVSYTGNPFKQLRSYHPVEGNSIIIKMDDSKPRPPHLPNISNDKPVPSYEPESSLCQTGSSVKLDGSDEDDDDEVSLDSHDSKAVNFIGANIIVGKSSLLKIRNKKLQILFDDKAVSTYEYPSEWTMLNENSDSDEWDGHDSTYCDINKPNGSLSRSIEPEPEYDHVPKKLNSNLVATPGGGLGNYTPMAVSNDQVFELGISRAPQPPVVTTSKPCDNSLESDVKDNEDVALSLKPAADDENVLWSSTQTSDILF